MLFLFTTMCAPKPEAQPDTSGGQTPELENSLANTKWVLDSFGGPGAETPVIENSSITLEFDAEGQAGGSGGCNSYGAQYEVQENKLSFGELTRTLIACEAEGIGQQEERYLQALERAGDFELAGDRLTIWYEDRQGVLNFSKAQN